MSDWDLESLLAELDVASTKPVSKPLPKSSEEPQRRAQRESATVSVSDSEDHDSHSFDELSSEEEIPKPLGARPPSKSTSFTACSACAQPIDDQTSLVQAFDEFFHANCLCCSKCGNLDGNFVRTAKDRRILCENCASSQYVCKVCSLPVADEFTMFEDGSYMHLGCVPTQPCGGCGRIIREDVSHIKAAGKWFHPFCFNCGTCNKPIDGKFSNKNGQLECESCLANSYKCSICNQFIEGQFLRLKTGEMMHPSCAPVENCATCSRSISLTDQHTVVLGKKYHLDCLKCNSCNRNIEGRFGMKGNHFICATCITSGAV